MKIKLSELKKIIREELLREEKEEDKDFNPADSALPIPAKLKKLLDPNLSPQKFASLDAELDDSGSFAHQAFAVAAFAMTYADNQGDAAKKLLQKALVVIPAIVKSLDAKPAEDEPAEDEPAKKEK